MDISPTIQHLHGRIRSITGTDPAAGEEISETVPARRRWKLISLRFDFVTNGTVADRIIYILIDDGTNPLFFIPYSVAQTASQTKAYNLTQQLSAPFAVNNHIFLPLPQLTIGPGYRIQTSTPSIKTGDNYSAPQLLVEEWIDP